VSGRMSSTAPTGSRSLPGQFSRRIRTHSDRVTDLCVSTLDALGIKGPDAGSVVAAARAHDIGKIGIPAEILMKPAPLTDEEWTLIETHPQRGANALMTCPQLKNIADLVRCHHERWDGDGYPGGLHGEEIPFGARLIAVCDSFDAMVTDRPYRRALSVQLATDILRQGQGSQWDPIIVDVFLRAVSA
jgi:HD-GYP domain-containing protein (c-di-GMP phosphodiesterase class II)